jgi:ferredoxin
MHNHLTKELFDLFPQEDKGDFFYSYIYMRHLDHFVYHALMAAGWPAKHPDNEVNDEIKELLEGIAQSVAETAGSVDTSTYHGKVMKLKDAIQMVTQKENIKLTPPETVIPYKQARDIILQNPESISLGECACRAVAETSCLAPGEMDVCIFVGDPHAAFISEANPKFRKISQDEAVKVLEDTHKKGFVHCAFFKKELGRRFMAICNCCSCCCQGMKAYNVFEGAVPILAPSGYVARAADDCIACGECLDACGFNAISMDEGIAVVNQEKCMGCGVCESRCETGTISMRLEPSKGEPLDLEVLLKQA